uniref:Uncharacterized protein n=1 Tax=viral metagenome TaxID=1070528 RepID=A0A6C0K0D7_9ZZZZ
MWEISKKDRTPHDNLYTCKQKKCKEIGDAIHKTYYG